MNNGIKDTKLAMKEYVFGKPKYRDADGNFKTLYQLFVTEPQWAMNRFRTVEVENEKLKTLLQEATEFEEMEHDYCHSPSAMTWRQKVEKALEDNDE